MGKLSFDVLILKEKKSHWKEVNVFSFKQC